MDNGIVQQQDKNEKQRCRVISWQKRLFYCWVRILAYLFFMIFYRIRFFGRNNLPEEGAVLIVSNHQSHFDAPVVGLGLRRRLNYMARKSLFHFKPFAAIIDLLDAIPLDIEGIGFEGVKESLRRLRGGECVLIFPEGARTWDGEMAPFKKGALTLAQRSRACILPTALEGCFQVWPRKNKFPWPWGQIRVVYGHPIPWEEFKDMDEEQLREMVRQRIDELIHRLKNRPEKIEES